MKSNRIVILDLLVVEEKKGMFFQALALYEFYIFYFKTKINKILVLSSAKHNAGS